MPLKISLKPNEKIFIGGAVLQNGGDNAELTILCDIPLLREKDILTEDEANSPCKQIYLCVQLMYIDPVNVAGYQQGYIRLIGEVMLAAPSTLRYIVDINNDLASGRYYQALKSARKLMEYEQELIKNALHPA